MRFPEILEVTVVSCGAASGCAKVESDAQHLVLDSAVLDLAEAVAVKAAVSRAVAKEKTKRKRLIDKAVDKAVDKAKAAAPEPRTLAAAPAESTDPRFRTCGEANAAGYGNYREGSDAEYGWYQDRDGDGFVCEKSPFDRVRPRSRNGNGPRALYLLCRE